MRGSLSSVTAHCFPPSLRAKSRSPLSGLDSWSLYRAQKLREEKDFLFNSSLLSQAFGARKALWESHYFLQRVMPRAENMLCFGADLHLFHISECGCVLCGRKQHFNVCVCMQCRGVSRRRKYHFLRGRFLEENEK